MLQGDLTAGDPPDYGAIPQSENNLQNVSIKSQGILSSSDGNQVSGISDYRGVPNSTSQSKEMNNQNMSIPNTKKTSFSNVLKASSFPKKDQAIIYPVVEGIPVKESEISSTPNMFYMHHVCQIIEFVYICPLKSLSTSL